MARIATDPNYNAPTFPRATAGTDLFLKEDVQALAAAVSTHVHDGTGKGLQVASIPASAISTGLITSAMIADGTIVAGDLADGAVTSAKILDGTIATADLAAHAASTTYVANGVAVAPATTSLVPVDVPDMVYTFVQPFVSDLRLAFSGSFIVSAGTYAIFNLLLDGSSAITGYIQTTAINVSLTLTGAVLASSAATHTVKVQWYLGSAGTVTAGATNRTLSIGVQAR